MSLETIPIQYKEGKARFMGMDIKVDHRVLIPRPETELLVSTVDCLCRQRGINNPFILDMCAGSGVVSIGLAKMFKSCRIIGMDICEQALDVARENIKRFALEEKIKLKVSDMFSEIGSEYENSFDVIVSNPPYVSDKDYENLDAWVKAEPKIALCAGKEGMDYLNCIARDAIKFLKPGAFAAVEVGYDQSVKIKNKFRVNGFESITSYRDFNNYERIIVGWKHG